MTDTIQPCRPARRRDRQPRRDTSRRTILGVATALGISMLTAASTEATARTTVAHAFGDPITYTATVTDRDDTDGRLDVASVRHRVRVANRDDVRIRYVVATHQRFHSARLGPRFRHFVIELNRDGERGSERNVRISSVGGRLVAEVISNATRTTIATVSVTRVDSRTLSVSGPRDLIGARSYFWTSNFHARWSDRCGQGDGYPITCQDIVPGRGWIRLDAPAWPVKP